MDRSEFLLDSSGETDRCCGSSRGEVEEASDSSAPLDAPEAVKGRSCTKSGASLFIATPGDPSEPRRLGNDGGPLSGELAKSDTIGGAANPAE